ncbi:uncharacterized protein J8A68_004601 [[Candida] subhashii]|uniref:Uncharacterized protein n=1 Tax=[Candida] subhashii TaxID=561895 RepID=A0A8J5QAV1_9ASCO|nr:uncharacterized protein J8A68_004601 [[Candida] subhashii]KAG7661881.1 hypothetical protein J8A68_004601 [[Candida] subhashii]
MGEHVDGIKVWQDMIQHKPKLNVQLQEISKGILDLLIETNQQDTKQHEYLVKHKEDAEKGYKHDIKHKQLFGNLFNTTLTIIDDSDGVARCGNCHWEAHGTICQHCGTRFRIPRHSEVFEDEDEEDFEDASNADLEINAYDSDDSFIDSRSIGDINTEELLRSSGITNDILSSDDENDLHEVRTSSYIHDDWNGFESAESDVEREVIELSGEDDDEFYDSDDVRDALDQFYGDRREGNPHFQSDDSDDSEILVGRSRAMVIDDDDDSDNDANHQRFEGGRNQEDQEERTQATHYEILDSDESQDDDQNDLHSQNAQYESLDDDQNGAGCEPDNHYDGVDSDNDMQEHTYEGDEYHDPQDSFEEAAQDDDYDQGDDYDRDDYGQDDGYGQGDDYDQGDDYGQDDDYGQGDDDYGQDDDGYY